MSTAAFTAAMYMAIFASELPTEYNKDPARFATIALAAEQVVEEQLPTWRRNPNELGAAVVTAMVFESGGWRSVHEGTRLGPTGDICLMQIHPGNGTWKRYAKAFSDLAGLGLEATKRCISTGARTLVTSLRHCHRKRYFKNWDKAMWSVYATGHNCWKSKQRFKRAAYARKIAWSKWEPTDEQKWMVQAAQVVERYQIPVVKPSAE